MLGNEVMLSILEQVNAFSQNMVDQSMKKL